MKAQSPLLLGGMPRQKRLYGSAAASSAPHLSRLNGGFATTVSNFISLSLAFSFGLRKVSPQRITALSNPCRNMFIIASAHVLPFTSCPYSEKLLLPTSLPALISNEPEPQVTSQIRAPGLLLVSFASSVETSAGVKKSPAFLPASPANVDTRYMYASPMMSLFSKCDSSKSTP